MLLIRLSVIIFVVTLVGCASVKYEYIGSALSVKHYYVNGDLQGRGGRPYSQYISYRVKDNIPAVLDDLRAEGYILVVLEDFGWKENIPDRTKVAFIHADPFYYLNPELIGTPSNKEVYGRHVSYVGSYCFNMVEEYFVIYDAISHDDKFLKLYNSAEECKLAVAIPVLDFLNLNKEPGFPLYYHGNDLWWGTDVVANFYIDYIPLEDIEELEVLERTVLEK